MTVTLPFSQYHSTQALLAAARMGQDILNPKFSPPNGPAGHTLAAVDWAKADHLTELAGLAVPALVIASEFDPLFPPPLARQAAQTIRDCEYLEIPDAPHVFFDH